VDSWWRRAPPGPAAVARPGRAAPTPTEKPWGPEGAELPAAAQLVFENDMADGRMS
jgi:hypothetical protein